MAAARPPIMADLKKAFAASHGCDVRTARRHANANSEQWQKFVAAYGMEAARKLDKAVPPAPAEAAALQAMSPASPLGLELPPQAWVPDEQLSEPERVVKQQWEIYKQAAKAWNAALQSGNEMGALALGQATIKAMDAYNKAQARLQVWQQENRRVIPMAEFQQLLPGLSAVFALLRNMPAELAQAANRTNPDQARAAANDWLTSRFHPAARGILEQLAGAAGIAA